MTARPSERGSIAILTLWGVALIFMLIAPVAFATRGEIRVAGNALAESRARLAAEAGTQLGLLRLLRRHDGGAAFDGTPEAWRQGSTRVTIAIADEAGKIDLNLAPPELLTGLFVAVGIPRQAAELIACNILERRGDSGVGCPEGETASPGRRFAVVEELAQVPGIDDRLYDRVADAVTVASGASAFDPMVASRTVLMAIPGATQGLVDSFLESRAMWRDIASAGAELIPAAAAPFVMVGPGRDYTVTATAIAADGARYRADLLVRLTGRAGQPYQVVAWRTPPADRGRAPPAKPRQAP